MAPSVMPRLKTTHAHTSPLPGEVVVTPRHSPSSPAAVHWAGRILSPRTSASLLETLSSPPALTHPYPRHRPHTGIPTLTAPERTEDKDSSGVPAPCRSTASQLCPTARHLRGAPVGNPAHHLPIRPRNAGHHLRVARNATRIPCHRHTLGGFGSPAFRQGSPGLGCPPPDPPRNPRRGARSAQPPRL